MHHSWSFQTKTAQSQLNVFIEILSPQWSWSFLLQTSSLWRLRRPLIVPNHDETGKEDGWGDSWLVQTYIQRTIKTLYCVLLWLLWEICSIRVIQFRSCYSDWLKRKYRIRLKYTSIFASTAQSILQVWREHLHHVHTGHDSCDEIRNTLKFIV